MKDQRFNDDLKVVLIAGLITLTVLLLGIYYFLGHSGQKNSLLEGITSKIIPQTNNNEGEFSAILSSGGVEKDPSNSLPPSLEDKILSSLNNWTENGTEVYFEDDKVFISSTARSMSPRINLKSKIFSGDITVAFGFPTQNVVPTAAYYNHVTGTQAMSYTCNGTFNYTTNPNYFWCYNATGVEFEHSFTSGNIPSKTANWTENVTTRTLVSNQFTKTTFFVGDVDTWYYKDNFNINANQTYSLDLELRNLNFGTDYKYWVAFWPSSETISQAIANEHFYALDPYTVGQLVTSWNLNAANSAATGACTNGTDVFVTQEGTPGKIYHYLISGTYVEVFSLTMNEPQGCTINNNTFYIPHRTSGIVYRYNMSGSAASPASFGTGLTSGGLRGITSNSTTLSYVDLVNDEVYIQNYSNASRGNFDTAAAGSDLPTDIDRSSKHYFLIDANDNAVYLFNNSGSNTSVFNVDAADTSPRGIGYNSVNGYLYVPDTATVKMYVYYGGDEASIATTLISPSNASFYNTTNSVNFNFNITPTSVNITNYTVYIYNGTAVYDSTTVTGLNDVNQTNYNTTITGIADGNFTWNVKGCGLSATLDGYCAYATTNLSFQVALASQIDVNIFSPVDYYNTTTGGVLQFIGNASDNSAVVNVSLIYDGVVDQTNTSGVIGNYTFNKLLTEATHTWSFRVCDDDGFCKDSMTRTLTYDGTAPTLSGVANLTSQLVYSVPVSSVWYYNATDANLDKCYYNTTENSTFTIITCNTYTTTNWTTGGNKTIYYYANDTLGQQSMSSASLTIYFVNETLQVSPNPIGEGAVAKFNLTVNLSNTPTQQAILVYNGTTYQPTVVEPGTNGYFFAVDIPIPTGSGNATGALVNYYWKYNVTGIVADKTTSTSNITVYALDIGSCGTYSNKLYNFTIRDEHNQSRIIGTTANIDMKLYAKDSGLLVASYNNSTSINPFSICSSASIDFEALLDAHLTYEAVGYVKENYYFKDEEVTSLNQDVNISLYDLDNSSSTTFKIVYRDSSFLPVANAIIQVQREYTSEGVSKTVEQVLTDTNGEVLVHLETENAVYTIIVLVNNQVSATFNNVRAYCPNPLIEECKISLTNFESYVSTKDFTTISGLSFNLDYNNTNREVSMIFSVLDGTAQNVSIAVAKFDGLGNSTVCTNEVTSSSGTLTCSIPTTLGNSSAVVTIYNDGVNVGRSVISLQNKPSDYYGYSIVIISLLALFLLIGIGFSGNVYLSSIILILGLIILSVMNVVFSTGIIGAGGTILWFIIAIVTVMIKGGSR